MCTYESASTILVLVTFSIVNFVFPFLPAILPIALDKWSPFNGFTSKREIGFLFQLRLLKFLLLTEHPNIKIILYFYLLVYWNYTWPLFALYYQEIKINLTKQIVISFGYLPSVTSKDSKNRSSSLTRAKPSYKIMHFSIKILK